MQQHLVQPLWYDNSRTFQLSTLNSQLSTLNSKVPLISRYGLSPH